MIYGVVWCGVVWSGVVWCGVVWCDYDNDYMIYMIYDMIWYDMIWYDMIYDMIVLKVIVQNTTEHHQWEVKIGSGNSLVPSGTKLFPELMLI